MFQDEAGFGRINKPKRCWCSKKTRPSVPCHHIREYRYAYGAVEPITGEHFFLVLPRCDTICMNVFLEELSKTYPDDEILLVCDGASWHRSKGLKKPNNIRLLKIPPYTPETDKVAWMFSKEPTKDFSRHRKLPFHKLAEIMIGMEGSTLSHEMLKCFHFSLQRPSVPAFIQQRAKLLPEAMAFVFSEVVRAFPCGSSVDGYRLIACDGSDLHYAVNPNEPENYFVVSEQARGYNLLHLNALYDLDSRRYVDALIQPRRQVDEIGAFITMIDRFPFDKKVIFTADRGYESYNVLAHMCTSLICFAYVSTCELFFSFLLLSRIPFHTTKSTNSLVRAPCCPILVTLRSAGGAYFVLRHSARGLTDPPSKPRRALPRCP